MRKLLLLVVAICFVCVLVSPALSAEPEKVIPGNKRVYYVPGQIVILNDGLRVISDPVLIEALEKRAAESPCLQALEIPGSGMLFINFCDFPTKPLCVRDTGTGKLCCPNRVPPCQ
jgi:hypothetical protein